MLHLTTKKWLCELRLAQGSFGERVQRGGGALARLHGAMRIFARSSNTSAVTRRTSGRRMVRNWEGEQVRLTAVGACAGYRVQRTAGERPTPEMNSGSHSEPIFFLWFSVPRKVSGT